MSKKGFKSQASSGRAISGAGGFGSGFGTSTFQTYSSPLSYVYEPPDLSGLSDANVGVYFKNLMKKDVTTKAKALEELEAYIKPAEVQIEETFLSAWVKLYPRLSIDSSRRVRQLAHTVQGHVSTRCGKRMVGYMPKVAGSWLAGTHDADRAVATAAQNALRGTFTTEEKIHNVSKVFQGSILEYCRDAVLEETVQTLSDERTVSADDAEATYARVLSTSLNVVASLISSLSREDLNKHLHIYETLLGEPKVWALAAYKDVTVRRSLLNLLKTSESKLEDILARHLQQLSSAIIDKALHSDQTGSATDLCISLHTLTVSYPTIWTTEYAGKKSAIQRLRQFVKRGSQSTPRFWPSLWTLLCDLPSEIIPKESSEARDLLKAFHEAANSRDERQNVPVAWETYFKSVDLLQQSLATSTAQSEGQQPLIEEMVLPVVAQYLIPTKETADWAITGANPVGTVAKTSLCRGFWSSLSKQWPEYVQRLVEDMQKSLPEQSKDYETSQNGVMAAGGRLASLQGAYLALNPQTFEEIRPTFQESSATLIQESLKLLASRNGKPYSAAAIVYDLVKADPEFLLNSDATKTSLTSFMSDDAPSLLFSRSQQYIFSILYSLEKDPSFAQIWNQMAHALVTSADSPEKDAAIRSFLSLPRALVAADLARQSTDIQEQLQRQYKSSLETNDWSAVVAIIGPVAGVVTESTTDAILSGLTEALSLNESAPSALDGLQRIVQKSGPLVGHYLSRPVGSQLLPNLLRLEESPDDTMAHKASDLNAQLAGGTTREMTQSAASDVVKRGLSETSQSSLPIHTLIELGKRMVEGSSPAQIGANLPDLEIWVQALSPFLAQPPPQSLSIMSPLGGALYMPRAASSRSQQVVARDSQGLSQAFRFVTYFAYNFAAPATFESLPEDLRAKSIRLCSLTVMLANDEISVKGANKLWVGPSEDDETQVPYFMTAAEGLLRHCAKAQKDEDPLYSFMGGVATDLLEASSGSTEPQALYSARAYASIQSQAIDRSSTGSSHVEEYAGLVDRYHKGRDLMPLFACLAAHEESLWTHKKLDRYCNELVANLTGSESTEAFEQLALFNVVVQQQDQTSTIAKQRLIFLVKHILPWLRDPGVAVPTKTEVSKALAYLLPGMSDMYGEHWAEALSAVSAICKAGFVREDDDSVDESRLPLVLAALRLYSSLRKLSRSQDPNDDLLDALKESEQPIFKSFITLLSREQRTPEETHQPLKITNELLAREIKNIPAKDLQDTSPLYPLIYSPSASIQSATFTLLGGHIRAAQEQVSFDAALENKEAHLPDELLSMILEAPTLDSLAESSFERKIPLELQGYLFSWLLVFAHFTNSSYKVKTDYINDIRNGSYLPDLLDLIFDLLGHSSGNVADISKMDIKTYNFGTEDSPECETQLLLAHIYYLCLLHTPSLTKTHYLSLTSRKTSQSVEGWTAKYISPLIVTQGLEDVAAWSTSSASDPDFENFSVKVSARSKEVNVSYLVDEQTMAIVIRLPDAYPLRGAQVEGLHRVAVDERRWLAWLRNCQGVITFSNGNLVDGVGAWRKNVAGALKGQTECAICYSIISGDKQLPSKRCGTCKNLFHSSCLFKWFKTSNASTCPLCRNAFNYG